MIVRFQAFTLVEELVVDNDPPYIHVGMADVSGSHYLTLHRSQPFSGGEDWGVYVEVDDQGFSGYDRIATCELLSDRMIVRFAKPLGIKHQIDGIEITFAAGHLPSPGFVTRLRAIFTGFESHLAVDGGRTGGEA